jgi:hypothetical protein
MPSITVDRPFTLTFDDGSQRHFKAGIHDVDEAIANHWFVKGMAKATPADEEQPDDEGKAPPKRRRPK